MNNEENRILEFDAVILQNGSMDAAFVKMGTPCYIIGVRKDIRKQIGKSFGDIMHVTFCERDKE